MSGFAERCIGRLALHRARIAGMALVACGDCDCLHRPVRLARHAKEIRAPNVPFCGMNSVAFIVIAILTLAAALAAATLQKLMHAALTFAVALVGVAAFFFSLGAEFVGLVLVFVYIGAVAVLIVFTILLTRRDVGKDRGTNWSGVIVAVAVFGGLIWTILETPSLSGVAPQIPALTVRRIGGALM